MCHCACSQFKHLTHTKGSSPEREGRERGGRQIFEPLSLTERLSKQLVLLPDILKGKLKNFTKNYDFDDIFFRFLSNPQRLCESVSIVMVKYFFNKSTGCSVAQIQMVVYLYGWLAVEMNDCMNASVVEKKRKIQKSDIRPYNVFN